MSKRVTKSPTDAPPMQVTYRGVGVLVVTYDYSNGAMQVTQSNLDDGVLWSMAKGVMDTAHNAGKPANE